MIQLLLAESGEHVVEDVVVPLPTGLVHDAGLLQQVLVYLGALYHPGRREVDVYVLAEATAVVVP